MLFAQSTILCILARLLGDGAHPTLLPWLFPLRWKSLLNLLEVIEQVTDTLGHRVCLAFVWGLPRPGANAKDMAREINIFDGPDLFDSLGCWIALVQTGQ